MTPHVVSNVSTKPHSPRDLAVWFWVVGLPLCLVALAALQYWRIGAADSEGDLVGQLGTLTRGAAMAAMVAGFAAAAAGAFGLLGAARAGRDALKSREVLITSFARWQQRLPHHLGLILGLTAVGLSLVAGLEMLFGLSRFGHGISGGEIKLRGTWLLVLVGLAWAAVTAYLRVRSAFAPYASTPRDVLGQTVSREQAPGLWQTVLTLAQQTGAAPPKQIVVGAVDSFYVMGGDIRLMPSQQRLTGMTLYMPITYLGLLQDQEIRAIVAHELAHFAGEDIVYSQRFAPLYHGFVLRLRALASARGQDGKISLSIVPALRLADHLLSQFHLAVMHWSRQREFAADALAAKVTDAHSLASSLLRVSGVDSQVNMALRLIAKPATSDAATAPMTWRDALLQSRQASADEQTALQGERDAAQPQFTVSHPTDTHPSTSERIQAVGLSFDAAMLERNRQRALNDEPQHLGSWFSQPDELEAQVLAEFRQRAQSDQAQLREQLSAMVNAAKDTDLCVYEARGWSIWVLGFLALGFVFSLPVVWLLNGRYGELFSEPLAWCCGIGAVFATFGVLSYIRSRHPVMLLRASGLQTYGMDREVAWSDIADWNVGMHGGTYTFHFTLNGAAAKYRRQHGNWMRLSYKAKKNWLIIKMASPKGMSAESLAQAIASHLRALAAKQLLARIEQQK